MGRSIRLAYPRLARRLLTQGRWGTLAQAGWTALAVRRGVRRGRPAGGPMLATLLMTYRCTNDCFMCDTLEVAKDRKSKGMKELDAAGLKALVDGFAELGVPALSLTGGEPLLRPEVPELVTYARSKGLLVHLNTNGMLVDEAMALTLLKAGIDSVNISLDGALPETHDRLRRAKGGFARVERAVAALRKARGKASGPAVNLVTVVSSENLEELPAIIGLARQWKADSIGLIPAQFFEKPSMNPMGDKGMTPARLEFLDRFLETLRDDPILESSAAYLGMFRSCFEGKPFSLNCLVGYHTLTVDCHANVYRCFPFGLMGVEPHPLAGRTLPQWWASEEAADLRLKSQACRSCYFNVHAEMNLLFQSALPATAGAA